MEAAHLNNASQNNGENLLWHNIIMIEGKFNAYKKR